MKRTVTTTEREKLWQEFKKDEGREFRIMGITQGILYLLIIFSLPLYIWVNAQTLFKAQITVFIIAFILGCIYIGWDKFLKKEFNKQMDEQ